ncbi:hypothetical protein ABK040_009506 [Willaertia magna]
MIIGRYYLLLLLFLLALSFKALSEELIEEDCIYFFQSAPLSGPSSSLGLNMRNGIQLAFNEINNLGGIRQKIKLKLITLDDSYEPAYTKQNSDLILYNISLPYLSPGYNSLLNNYPNLFSNGTLKSNVKIFGYIGVVGTPTSVNILSDVVKNNVPFIGAFSGSNLLRKFYRNIINIRSSYYDEMTAIINYIINVLKFKKISIFYQNDTYGKSGLDGALRVLNHLNLTLRSVGTYERNTLSIEDGFINVGKGNPKAILCVGTYAPVAKYIKRVRDLSLNSYVGNNYGYEEKDILFFTVSFIGSTELSEELLNYTNNQLSINPNFEKETYIKNVYVSQVIPSPYNITYPIVKSYYAAKYGDFRSAGLLANIPSFVELEGYIVGKFTYMVLSSILGNITRESFLNAVYYSSMHDNYNNIIGNDLNGRMLMFDGLQMGPFRSCYNPYLIDEISSTKIDIVNNTFCNEQYNCNQGLKVVYLTEMNLNSQGKVNFTVIDKPFDWNCKDNQDLSSCISDVTKVYKPIIFGQSININKYDKDLELYNKGMGIAFQMRNSKYPNRGKIELLIKYHSDTKSLLKRVKEFIEEDEAVSLVGISNEMLTINNGGNKIPTDSGYNINLIDLENNYLFNSIPIIDIYNSINNNLLRTKYLKNNLFTHLSITEVFGSIIEYNYNKQGKSRFSIIYDDTSIQHFKLFEYLLNNVNLTIDSSSSISNNSNIEVLNNLLSNNGNPQVLVFLINDLSTVNNLTKQLISSYNQIIKFNGKRIIFRKNLQIYFTQSIYNSNELFNLLNSFKTNFIQFYIASHIPSIEDESFTLISNFKNYLKTNELNIFNNNSLLYNQRLLEGYMTGLFIVNVVENINEENTNSVNFLDTIYKINSFQINNIKLGLFKKDNTDNCNLGMRSSYIYRQGQDNRNLIYEKVFTSNTCGLNIIYDTTISSNLPKPIILGRLIPFNNDLTISNEHELVTELYPNDSFTIGLLTYIYYLNSKNNFNIYLHTEYYLHSNNSFNEYSLISKMDQFINKNKVLLFTGLNIRSNTTFNVVQLFKDMKYLLYSNSIPLINTLSNTNYLKNPYFKYFINMRPSVVDEMVTIFKYFTKNNYNNVYSLICSNNDYWKNNVYLIIKIINSMGYSINHLFYYNEEINNDIYNRIIENRINKILFLGDGQSLQRLLQVVDKSIFIGISSDTLNDLGMKQNITQNLITTYLLNLPNYYLMIENHNQTNFIKKYFSNYNKYAQTISTRSDGNDRYILEGYTTGYFIDTIIKETLGEKDITTITSNDIVDKAYSQSVYNIGNILELGPIGSECVASSSAVTTTNSIADLSLPSLGCDCNQLSRHVVIYNASSNDAIYDNEFETCGAQVIPATALSTVAIIIICLTVPLSLLIIVIVSVILYRLYLKRKLSLNAPKSGKIAIIFTDIQNSSVLWQTNEKAMREALIIHNHIMRKNLEHYNGYEVKTNGDSFYVVFQDPIQALDWAIKTQHDLLYATWPGELYNQFDCRQTWNELDRSLIWSGLRVRMGVHYGRAHLVHDKVVRRPDYFGTAINKSARIESIANGGQILVSEKFFLETFRRARTSLYHQVIFEETNMNEYVPEIISYMTNSTNSSQSISSFTSTATGTTSKTSKTKSLMALNNEKPAGLKYINHRPKLQTYKAEDLGEYCLKGLKGATRLFQIKSREMMKRTYPPLRISSHSMEVKEKQDHIIEVKESAKEKIESEEMELKKKSSNIVVPIVNE